MFLVFLYSVIFYYLVQLVLTLLFVTCLHDLVVILINHLVHLCHYFVDFNRFNQCYRYSHCANYLIVSFTQCLYYFLVNSLFFVCLLHEIFVFSFLLLLLVNQNCKYHPKLKLCRPFTVFKIKPINLLHHIFIDIMLFLNHFHACSTFNYSL